MAEDLLKELTQKISEMTIPNTGASVSAVSLKLPDFWTRSPEVWFAKVEAQFNTKQITSDQTKYDYVISALDVSVAEEVQNILLNPPAEDKFVKLKEALLATFGKSQSERDAELLSLNGLGDRRPTALLRKIENLNNDPKTLKRALFLANLPPTMRPILAAQNIPEMDKLAEAADRIWEVNHGQVLTNISSVNSPDLLGASNEAQPDVEVDAMQHASPFAFKGQRGFRKTTYRYQNDRRQNRPAVSQSPKQQTTNNASSHNPSSGTQAHICHFHRKFGMKAFKCEGNCTFSSLVSGNAHSPR